MNCPCCQSHSSRLGRKNGHQLFSCTSCGHITTRPLPNLSEVSKLYDAAFFSRGEQEFEGNGYKDVESEDWRVGQLAIFEQRFAIIKKYVSTPTSLIDIGCANGLILRDVSARGIAAAGVEINDHMRALALSGCPEGHFFPSLDEVIGKYDVVTMWEYLEHVIDPEHDLKLVKEFMNPGGLLCLSFPNIECRPTTRKKLSWVQVCPPVHLHYWTASSIKAFLGRFGFAVRGFRYHGLRYPLEARRTFGSRGNKKTVLWPLSGTLAKLTKRYSRTAIRQDFSSAVRRSYEGVEVYAQYEHTT